MIQHFYVGVDGGATKTAVRVEDANGKLLGQVIGGPANIRISVDQAWLSINEALHRILHPVGVSFTHGGYQFHAGIGLAGYEIAEARDSFEKYTHGFNKLVLTSDAHIACLGAHNNNDGAIIIAGTGVVGFQMQAGETHKVSGWGFPHDDQGGGAWLGLEAVKIALQWLDGRLPKSGLSEAVFQHFNNDRDQLVIWANQANSSAFAEIAPLVIRQSQEHDPTAMNLLWWAAQALEKVGDALVTAEKKSTQDTHLPCTLIGSITPFLQPFLGEKLRSRLRPAQLPPEAGAILLIRDYCKHLKE